MKFIILFSLVLLWALGTTGICVAQEKLQGIVIDAQTKAPLPGVNVSVVDTPLGTITDHQGQFTLHTSQTIDTLLFSYVGYETKKVVPTGEPITVKLSQSFTALNQVVVRWSNLAGQL